MHEYSGFTAHASLAALGQQMQTWRIWRAVERQVQIKQKVIKDRPTDKLLDEFITLLAGGQGVVEINSRLRPDAALQRAFGRARCAEQSTVSDTLAACTPANVHQMRQALQRLFRQRSQAYRHAYQQAWQWLDVDMTGLPAGRQADGAEKGYFAGQRNRRGRQLGRVLASRYDEIVFEQLYPGSRQLERSLPELMAGAEQVLDLTRPKRTQTAVRLDGGGGSDADLDWLLGRGYGVLGKVHSWKRAAKLAASVTTWHPEPQPAERQWGWIEQPHAYVQPTRQLALRWPHPHKADAWQYAVLVWNLPDQVVYALAGLTPPRRADPGALAQALRTAYDRRGGGVETALKGSKGGLHIHQRNTKRFEAQQMRLLLAELAYNLLTWLRQQLQDADPRLAHWGPLRLVRDLLAISGQVTWNAQGHVLTLVLNQAHACAAAVATALQPAFTRHKTRLCLGQI